jgi:putative ABC transport system permease protein
VLFNLSNINITERVREIATIKVLGFYPRETGSYVFRENFILTLMGIVVGLPLGCLLHRFVMSQIQVDMVAFATRIMNISYLYSVLIVLAFLIIVDLVMRRKIDKIDMAESLKSIE